jgi:hypothetical protein
MNQELVEAIIEMIDTPQVRLAASGGAFIGQAKRSARLPYVIVNQIVDGAQRSTNSGQILDYLVQISSFAGGAEPSHGARAVDRAVYRAINRARNEAKNILSIQSINSIEFDDREPDENGFSVRHVMREYRVEFAEPLVNKDETIGD